MRLRRLDLLRYGHFTDRSFDLPSGDRDLHIVFGPNEAGKSTALTAIEDLLFGIPMKSPHNFLHDYASMRIGAVLETGGDALELVRRKGNKDTLLGPDGAPLAGGDGALDPYLAGADRAFFERMFSLDHIRLQAGGREILDARDDVGQMLFAAGAGIAGLRERLGELEEEAAGLWGKRRAGHRKFYQASDRLDAARAALREETLTAARWQELKRTFEEADAAYETIDTAFRETSAERNRLNRVRRVLRDVRRRQELDTELAGLEDAPLLPQDAGETVAAAEREDATAAARIATLREQLRQAEETLEGLAIDDRVLARADDIRQLHERRIEVRREKADLPKREAELAHALDALRAAAGELGWSETDPEALIARIPSRTGIAAVRELLTQKGEREADVANRTRALREARVERDGLRERFEGMGAPADVSRLALLVRTIREQGDLDGHVRGAEKAVRDGEALVRRRLSALTPAVADEGALAEAPVPSRATVRDHRDRTHALTQTLRDTRREIASAERERDAAQAAFERTLHDEQVVTPEDLAEARARRDTLWALVKRKHVTGEPVPEEADPNSDGDMDDPAAAFEPALARADDLADRRFDHAEAAGRLAETKRTIEAQDTALEQLRASEAELADELDRLSADWAALWEAAPADPLAADAMLDWLEARKAVLEAVAERDAAARALEAARDEAGTARQALLGELAALGVETGALENDGLSLVLERAAQEQRDREAEAARKAALEEEIRKADGAVARHERDLEEAAGALEAWRERWTAALGEIGLAPDTAPEAVGAQIDTVDDMREAAKDVRTLKHDRIDKIRRDLADFETVVGELVADVAENLAGEPAEEAVLALEKRLADAELAREKHESASGNRKALAGEISKLEDDRRERAAAVDRLKQAAGVETAEALKDAIARSELKRKRGDERQELVDRLHAEGDGKSLEELERECEGIAIDEVVARDASIETELADLRARQSEAAEERSRARDAFQAVGGGDAAAQAAANRQEALAELGDIAERYVRVKTSALLLEWAIDRYRREKQAPLLKRAGALFQTMTGGSFSGLEVAFDDQDSAHLTGMRPGGGEAVPVSGMSTGTADQLYLALRIAAIEDYLDRAEALPFVADDLFINFDDDRAAAGFRLLAELAGKTQVLFFTHHRHLVDIARATLGGAVNLIALHEDESAGA
ncbi:AAA family ATPase [Kaustia mangrovi]|uniref:AAA family ATPase n=1 Tax=Kaustia mangrovi TaxID=2593653 RepID=A0A7S8HBU5_9HYPH|nr:YhaN family protein [Kaustia mangrovi]QPC42945.1 AAA family ATPase [Kaustia mangrovi]